jgi:hypothetical protein
MKPACVHRIDCVHHYDRTEFYATSLLQFQPKSCMFLPTFQQIFTLLFMTYETVCLINAVSMQYSILNMLQK